MKSKKAQKRLDEVEQLLRDVQEKYTGATGQFTHALQALRASVQSAKELIQPDHATDDKKPRSADRPGTATPSPARGNSAPKPKTQAPRAKA